MWNSVMCRYLSVWHKELEALERKSLCGGFCQVMQQKEKENPTTYLLHALIYSSGKNVTL